MCDVWVVDILFLFADASHVYLTEKHRVMQAYDDLVKVLAARAWGDGQCCCSSPLLQRPAATPPSGEDPLHWNEEDDAILEDALREPQKLTLQNIFSMLSCDSERRKGSIQLVQYCLVSERGEEVYKQKIRCLFVLAQARATWCVAYSRDARVCASVCRTCTRESECVFVRACVRATSDDNHSCACPTIACMRAGN